MKPKAYLKGYIEFYKLKFKVTPDVLIPRPETELLVDEVLHFVSQLPTISQPQALTILDLGTGSGNIAISIAKNLPENLNFHIIATDISSKALKVTILNAKLHGVNKKITCIKGNLLSAFPSPNISASHTSCGNTKAKKLQGIDIIVTNLPYIPTARIPCLDSSVKDFEPHLALDGGEDGFELYRKLFQQITNFSRSRGWKLKLIVGEIDYTQGELATTEAEKYFPKARAEVKTDLAHKQRILIIQL